jgi:hypothetical protein
MIVLAVDPGYEQSAWLAFDGRRAMAHAIEPNALLLERFELMKDEGVTMPGFSDVAAIVFEQIESFGMAVGREVFETVFWTGRLFQAAQIHADVTTETLRMPRRAVKLHLCQSARAQDSNIRVALLDRFGGTERAVGKKASPGPLYGIKSHEWSALAIAVTWWDEHHVERARPVLNPELGPGVRTRP